MRLALAALAAPALAASDGAIWGVVTTIFRPTPAVHAFLANDASARVVVVGDVKTAEAPWLELVGAQRGRVVYLSAAEQGRLALRSTTLLPWNHFGRKNLGFLVAARRGARWVFDFDDDNIMGGANRSHGGLYHAIVSGRARAALVETSHHLYNPYPDFLGRRAGEPGERADGGPVWPRGFPLEFIQEAETAGRPASAEAELGRVAVFQSLADHNPDVDAIYRMTRRLPLYFGAHHKVVALPAGTYAPLNAQATLWRSSGLWGTLLPVTVASRVADIWRAYIVQRMLWELEGGLRVGFTAPLVTQLRNPHSYLSDLESELELYTKSSALLQALSAWTRKPGHTAPEAFVDLFAALAEQEILGNTDVALAALWVEDLREIGYKWPPLGAPLRARALPEPPVIDERCERDANATSVVTHDQKARGHGKGGGAGQKQRVQEVRAPTPPPPPHTARPRARPRPRRRPTGARTPGRCSRPTLRPRPSSASCAASQRSRRRESRNRAPKETSQTSNSTSQNAVAVLLKTKSRAKPMVGGYFPTFRGIPIPSAFRIVGRSAGWPVGVAGPALGRLAESQSAAGSGVARDWTRHTGSCAMCHVLSRFRRGRLRTKISFLQPGPERGGEEK